MNRNLLLITFFILFIISARSQVYDFTDFGGLQSAGIIPEDFTKLSSVKFKEDKEQTEASKNRREQKDKETFLLESNFLMDNILHSGQVLFGDPVTNYLNEIKDEIFKDDPDAGGQIRVYTLRSTEVNAFTSNNGIVLVTTGLIEQVENEAQLAFILCHEFSHYLEKHALTGYVETKKMDRGDGIYKSLKTKDTNLEKFRYSKELETEADDLGFELFEKTKYSLDAVKGVFDVLLYAYLPFDELEFNKRFFDDNRFVLPSGYFLDTLSAITAEEDYDDAEHTHPNIKKRRELINTKLETTTNSNSERQLYIQPEAEFDFVQKLCRYDGCELYLNNIEYQDAIYQAYLLMQSDSSNIYLEQVIVQALYGLSMYHNQNIEKPWNRGFMEVEGKSQQVFYLFDKLPDNQLNILALKQAWALHKKQPGNKYYLSVCKQLAHELKDMHDLVLKDFYTAAQAQKDTTTLIEMKSDSTVLSLEKSYEADDKAVRITKKSAKYEMIKKAEKELKVKIESSYWKFAFTAYMDDKDFIALFEQDEQAETADKFITTFKKRRPVYHLGADELVIVNPVYLKIDERTKNPVLYEAAEKARLDLKDKIMACADALNMEIEYLDHNLLDAAEVSKFNDLAQLNAWLDEQLDHADAEVQMLNSNSEDFLQLSNTYKIDHFAWVGIVGFTEKENDWVKLFYAWVGGIYLPVAIVDVATPDYWTYMFVLVADAKTGEIQMTFYNAVEVKDNASTQKSNLYYILQQIKNK